MEDIFGMARDLLNLVAPPQTKSGSKQSFG